MLGDIQVSIVLGCYNHSRYLSEIFDSLLSLDMLGIEAEVIIFDDYSSDDSQSIIKANKNRLENKFGKGRVRLFLNQENKGLCANLNRCLRELHGTYFAATSCDDIFHSKKLIQSFNALIEDSDKVAVVYGNMDIVDEAHILTGKLYYPEIVSRFAESQPPSGWVYENLLESCFVSAPTALILTQAARDVGGYDEELGAEDYDMWLRLAKRWKFRYVDAPLVSYRLHSENLHKSLPKAELDTMRTFNKHNHKKLAQKKCRSAFLRLYGRDRSLATVAHQQFSQGDSFGIFYGLCLRFSLPCFFVKRVARLFFL